MQKAGGRAAVGLVELQGSNSGGWQSMNNGMRSMIYVRNEWLWDQDKRWHPVDSSSHGPAMYAHAVWGESWELPEAPQPPLSIRVTDDAGNKVAVRCTLPRLCSPCLCSGNS